MGLKKEYTNRQSDVRAEGYHMINDVIINKGQEEISFLVTKFKDQDARDGGVQREDQKNYILSGDKYIEIRDLIITKCYEYIESLPEYDGAVDVL